MTIKTRVLVGEEMIIIRITTILLVGERTTTRITTILRVGEEIIIKHRVRTTLLVVAIITKGQMTTPTRGVRETSRTRPIVPTPGVTTLTTILGVIIMANLPMTPARLGVEETPRATISSLTTTLTP